MNAQPLLAQPSPVEETASGSRAVSSPSETAPASAGGAQSTVTLRELNQHSGRYIQRASQGEVLTVTDRGRPVAQIIPFPVQETPFERMVREGKVRLPTERYRPLEKRYKLPDGLTIEKLLAEDREERY